MRATVLSWTILAVCMLTELRHRVAYAFDACRRARLDDGRDDRRLVSIVGAAMMLAMWHDPATLEEWRRSGGLDEAFIDVPLKLIAIGITMGIPGAALGKGVTRRVTLSG